ncbi:MAG: phosphotransferase [Gammaproteobacteria bacterium]|nr:phosphotransferase [Gammaproteobacteria bacterium]
MTKPFQMLYLQASEPFKARYADVLTPQAVHLIDWLRDHYFEITKALARRPSTLIHGDFRLDNLCFDDDAGDVILFDWQTLGVGMWHPRFGLFPRARQFCGRSRGWHGLYTDRLLSRTDVETRSPRVGEEALRWEFDVCLLMMLHRLVPAEFQDMLDLGDGRGNELLSDVDGAHHDTRSGHRSGCAAALAAGPCRYALVGSSCSSLIARAPVREGENQCEPDADRRRRRCPRVVRSPSRRRGAASRR